MIFKFFLVIRTIVNFPTAFLDKLGLMSGLTIYKIRGEDKCFIARCGSEDMAEIVVVYSGYEYRFDLISFSNNPVILDVGGHIGTFSILADKITKGDAAIYAFEPNEENFAILSANLLVNKVKTVTANQLGISNYSGKGFLKTKDLNTDAYYLETNKKKIYNCDVITLKKALELNRLKYVDLLKIDIEGGEYDLFTHKETFNTISSKIHYIFMEYHNINSKKNYPTIKKIIESKFKVINQRGNILTLENKFWKSK